MMTIGKYRPQVYRSLLRCMDARVKPGHDG
jgi:hypothetical protein